MYCSSSILIRSTYSRCIRGIDKYACNDIGYVPIVTSKLTFVHENKESNLNLRSMSNKTNIKHE